MMAFNEVIEKILRAHADDSSPKKLVMLRVEDVRATVAYIDRLKQLLVKTGEKVNIQQFDLTHERSKSRSLERQVKELSEEVALYVEYVEGGRRYP